MTFYKRAFVTLSPIAEPQVASKVETVLRDKEGAGLLTNEKPNDLST